MTIIDECVYHAYNKRLPADDRFANNLTTAQLACTDFPRIFPHLPTGSHIVWELSESYGHINSLHEAAKTVRLSNILDRDYGSA
jgi:hypothetical protein